MRMIIMAVSRMEGATWQGMKAVSSHWLKTSKEMVTSVLCRKLLLSASNKNELASGFCPDIPQRNLAWSTP